MFSAVSSNSAARLALNHPPGHYTRPGTATLPTTFAGVETHSPYSGHWGTRTLRLRSDTAISQLQTYRPRTSASASWQSRMSGLSPGGPISHKAFILIDLSNKFHFLYISCLCKFVHGGDLFKVWSTHLTPRHAFMCVINELHHVSCVMLQTATHHAMPRCAPHREVSNSNVLKDFSLSNAYV